MKRRVRILIVGTADTKADELLFMKQCIEAQDATAYIMDVGVLGTPSFTPDYSKHQVAAAANTTIEGIIALGDENAAMTRMAEGAARLASDLHHRGEIDALLALGGTMGTDLALDVASALPLGVPKFVVSTVAYSHLIPPERLSPDLMMILWAGGLYGLNSICRSILSQASGAVVGACAGVAPKSDRPRVAIGALGKSCLSYMVELNPALEKRGFEPVVFHCTGMGGRAMESLIEQGAFVAVFDFALNEVGALLYGSVVHAGPSRLETAGRVGVPQIVAPGASDMLDVAAWAPMPPQYADRPYPAHNRLIGSVIPTREERRALARHIAAKLNRATGPTAFLVPRRGIHAWDLPDQPLHDPESHHAYCEEFVKSLSAPVQVHDLNMHINDSAFIAKALEVFDAWVAAGVIKS